MFGFLKCCVYDALQSLLLLVAVRPHQDVIGQGTFNGENTGANRFSLILSGSKAATVHSSPGRLCHVSTSSLQRCGRPGI